MLRQKFEEITKRIWEDIYLANKYGTIFGEESITDSILLELAKQNYFNIRILQTPKTMESLQGTDWEWFVGSYEYGWIRYAIQAKKLNLNTNTYDSLNHKVGQAPNDEYQIKLLRTFSTVNGAVPLYNFYNYYPAAKEDEHWHCDKLFEKELLGWTFTPLSNVENAVKKWGHRSFDKIHCLPDTLPIRCLFSCVNFKDIFLDKSTIKKSGIFCGEAFRKVEKLPQQFINAREIGVLHDFPQELYNPQIKIYPKRIMIIEIPESQ